MGYTINNRKLKARDTWISLLQVLLKPFDSLFARIIHGLLILLASPITSQRKSVNLILIDLSLKSAQFYSNGKMRSKGILGAYPNLMRNIRFLRQTVLNLSDAGNI